jgi:hypothetical protein
VIVDSLLEGRSAGDGNRKVEKESMCSKGGLAISIEPGEDY